MGCRLCWCLLRRGLRKGCPLVPDVRLEAAATARALANDECGAQRRVSQRPVHDFELACGSRRQGSAVTSSAQRAVLARPDPSEHHLGDATTPARDAIADAVCLAWRA